MIIPRKTRPFQFPAPVEWAIARGADQLSGVLVRDDGVWCARDAVETVSQILEWPLDRAVLSKYDTVEAKDWPGLDEYNRLFTPKDRPYQPLGSAFVAARSSVMECDPCRCLAGDSELTIRFSNRLFDEGVFGTSVVFPTVALDRARIRTIVTAAHTDDLLDRALTAFDTVGHELGVISG